MLHFMHGVILFNFYYPVFQCVFFILSNRSEHMHNNNNTYLKKENTRNQKAEKICTGLAKSKGISIAIDYPYSK